MLQILSKLQKSNNRHKDFFRSFVRPFVAFRKSGYQYDTTLSTENEISLPNEVGITALPCADITPSPGLPSSLLASHWGAALPPSYWRAALPP